VFTAAVQADFLSLEVGCDECIPGRTTAYNLTITNEGEDDIQLIGFDIVDDASGKKLVEERKEFAEDIIPGTSRTFSERGRIPYPEEGNTSKVHVCLVKEPDLEAWGKAGKEIEHCYDEIIFEFPIIPCLLNLDCNDDEICTGNSCIPLNCSYCQYTEDHQCKDYECCKDEECTRDAECVSNQCRPLACAPEEYIVNHTCSSTACRFDEGIINFTCVPLDCKEDEFIKNHECKPLDCEEGQYIFNNTCKDLNCSATEFAKDHACRALNCKDTQAYVNHACKDLDCNIFQKAQGHECRLNSFLLVEAFFLFIIYFLITLNIEKYIYVKKKKIVHRFFKGKHDGKRTDRKSGKD
jgi:hypothetical protein